ncbi:hypothetical protein ACW7N6_38040 [Streptomyces sp. UC1A3]
MGNGEPKLRKTETRDVRWAVATYEVLVDGVVVGTVTKYDMPGERKGRTFQGVGEVPGRVIRWTADVYGTEDDEPHKRRKDAVDLLVHVHRTKEARNEE